MIAVVRAPMFGGTPSDYPFDHYRVSLGFSAASGTTTLTVSMKFSDADPFFVVKPTGSFSTTTLLAPRVSRSRSTFIFAWFMMAAMWSPALAVFGAARVLVRRESGLVWPSLGWMAATLFALAGLRNTAPGSPPAGSLLDCLAFFWAEGIIAGSLVWTVLTGIRVERRALRRAAAEAARA